MKTKFLVLFALVAMLLTMAISAADVSVTLNGQPLSFDQPPVIIDGRTMVPLRAIFEALGASVEWDSATRTVHSQKDDVNVSLTVGSNEFYKNETAVQLDVPAQIVNGRTLVPARAIAEAYGVDVYWNASLKTVQLIQCEHEPEVLPGEEASCKNDGLTEGAMCSKCGKVLVEQEKIPALPHDTEVFHGYDATFDETGFTDGLRCKVCKLVTKEREIIPVKKREITHTTLYEDRSVKFTYLRTEKSRYSSDGVEVFLDVKNKTSRKITIQCDAVSLNGYTFNNIIMSDPVAANSTGTVSVSVSQFDANFVKLGAIYSFGAKFRVIPHDENDRFGKSYEAVIKTLDMSTGEEITECPELKDTKSELYSDSNVIMYFDRAEKDKYSDDEIEIYLIVQNTSDTTILIQNNTVIVDGRSYNSTIMSDPVLAHTTGRVNVSVRKYSDAATASSIKTIGGEFRIIDDDGSNKTYTATLGKSSSGNSFSGSSGSSYDEEDYDDDDGNYSSSGSTTSSGKKYSYTDAVNLGNYAKNAADAAGLAVDYALKAMSAGNSTYCALYLKYSVMYAGQAYGYFDSIDKLISKKTTITFTDGTTLNSKVTEAKKQLKKVKGLNITTSNADSDLAQEVWDSCFSANVTAIAVLKAATQLMEQILG